MRILTSSQSLFGQGVAGTASGVTKIALSLLAGMAETCHNPRHEKPME
jgi:hypothetical protein